MKQGFLFPDGTTQGDLFPDDEQGLFVEDDAQAESGATAIAPLGPARIRLQPIHGLPSAFNHCTLEGEPVHHRPQLPLRDHRTA